MIERVKKGTVFVTEGEPVDTVYFVGEGVIKATDYRVFGNSFDFMLFKNVYAYGGMEVIMECDAYKTSLQTVTDCTILKIPKSKYTKWIGTDIKALKYESRLMGEYLLEQSRNVRAFLFLQGSDRLSMLFCNRYENYAVNGILRLNNDRQELSDFTGLSVKTITRAVQKLREEELVTKSGNSICINRKQYLKLKDNLSRILSDDEE